MGKKFGVTLSRRQVEEVEGEGERKGSSYGRKIVKVDEEEVGKI